MNVRTWLTLVLLPGNLATIARADEPSAFVFTSFRGNGEDGLHLAWSPDGLTWKALGGDRPFLTSKVGGGLMRDPCLAAGPDGTYHLVWTTAWNRQGIGYAHSRDLTHWSEPRLLDVMAHEPTTRNVWAPDLYFDVAKGRWWIVWASTVPGRFEAGSKAGDEGYNHRMYATTTSDFVDFTPTRLFFDPGHNVIDATLVRDEAHDRVLLISKDETRTPPAKDLRIASAATPEGPFRPLLDHPITGKYWAEGPTAIRIGETWHVYFDRYTEHRYGLVTSTDLIHWVDASDRVSFPKDHRHGTVLRVPASLVRSLDAKPATEAP
jgi:sucrose-6-phosphate hydrolase SacC (GH32 family)